MNPLRGLLFSWLAATLPPAGVGESPHTAKCLLLHLLLLLPPGVKEKKGKETVEKLWFSPGNPSGGRGVRISPGRGRSRSTVQPRRWEEPRRTQSYGAIADPKMFTRGVRVRSSGSFSFPLRSRRLGVSAFSIPSP